MTLPLPGDDEVAFGVAITVPEPYGPRLQAARGVFGDAVGALIPAHVTLLGPTLRGTDMLGTVTEHLEAVASAHRPFRMVLRGTATFRPVTPVVFVQVALGWDECVALERQVRSGPLAGEVEFPYHPHVTIAHEVDDAALDAAVAGFAEFEAEFEVRSFHLYDGGGEQGGTPRPAREFVLG